MVIDNLVRVAVVLLAVSLGSIVGTASAEEGSSSSQLVKQDVLSVKTLNLRWDQWNHEAGSELKVCPGRFRTIGGEIRCRVPDGGLNGLLGGMVTGESMTVNWQAVPPRFLISLRTATRTGCRSSSHIRLLVVRCRPSRISARLPLAIPPRRTASPNQSLVGVLE